MRALLASTVGYGQGDGDDLLDRLTALIEGLRFGICLPERPLPMPRVREILRRVAS